MHGTVWKVRLIQVAALCVVVAVWEFLVAGGFGHRVLPSPLATASNAVKLLGQGAFLSQAGQTALYVTIATSVGMVLGTLAAVVVPRRWSRWMNLITQTGLATPQAVLLPIFLLIFGVSALEVVIVGITHLLFVVTVTIRSAYESIPEEITDVARYYGCSRRSLIRKVVLPYMVPSFMQAVRFGIVFSTTGVLIAELYVSSSGLGTLLEKWASLGNIQAISGCVVVVAATTIVVNSGLFFVERRFGGWRAS